MTDPVDTQKRALRAELRERRAQLPQAARDAAAQGVSDQLDALVASVGAHSVSCFISTPTEPGTRDFLTAAVRRGIRVLLPVTRVDGLLDWAVATDDENVADVIAKWKETQGAVGIRIFLREEEKRAADHPGLDRICRAAVRYDLPLNFLFWGRVDDGMKIIDRHPETRFIVDHLGLLQPRVPPAPAEPWADLPKILDLAKRPNAVIKISGACTLSKQPYPFPDIWDPLKRIFNAWGFERCLWGTDWTRAFAVVNYENAVKPFLETKTLSDSERAMLMGGACAKAYGWSPKR